MRNIQKKAKENLLGEVDDGYVTPPEEVDARAESYHLRKHIVDLKAHHEYEISILRTALQQEKDHYKKMKDSVNKMQIAMENKDLFIGQQDSDDMVYSRFQALIGKIKTWSVPFAQGNAPLPLAYSDAVMMDIYKVVPNLDNFERFLQTPKDMRLFVRGFVGLAMTETIFRAVPYDSSVAFAGQDVWMDKDLALATSTIEQRFYYTGEWV